MKILVISGSPRAKGNTHAMIDAFAASARDKGHEVEIVDATKLSIGGCHACETCYKKGVPCNFNPDFNTIAPQLLEAEAIVFATPVYWYTMPAQIKAIIDCIYSFCIGGKENIFGKKCALICCCEEHDASVMDGVRMPIERMAALLKWEMVGSVLVPGVLKVGDIDNTNGCKQAAELAAKF